MHWDQSFPDLESGVYSTDRHDQMKASSDQGLGVLSESSPVRDAFGLTPKPFFVNNHSSPSQSSPVLVLPSKALLVKSPRSRPPLLTPSNILPVLRFPTVQQPDSAHLFGSLVELSS